MKRKGFKFSDSLWERLRKTAVEKTTTRREIVRRALALYFYLDAECKDGSKIMVSNKKTGTSREIYLSGGNDGIKSGTAETG